MHLIPRTIWVVARARRRPRAGLWEPTTLPMRALPTDVDMALHVNNGQYFGLFDLGRFDAMVRTGLWDEIRRRGWTPVVQAEQIAFRRSVTLGQRFDVETRMIGLDERAVWFEQRVVVDGDVAVRAYICTRLRTKDGRPVENDEVRAIAATAGHDLAGEPTLPEWLHEWRRSVALPSARTPLPHTWDLDTVRRG
ncbi:acyl-CoA thioesterase [Micrococcus luteus]|uniref:acyl-CoA thioesterase n=1 Tax=Micrococcus luteus TaxID=1270 RepID=UPI00254CD02D|nr:acyl-CoA thioesterase [Micrococcus luteus]MDK7869586.1 acyl-CoA thioesterase [Micrococcus luteus]MDK8526546.1 acyl-CoA thioesterase [Micrococcus luteus]MDK8728512.1 acyl-CoA thioesterase [Micrococcus luteus]